MVTPMLAGRNLPTSLMIDWGRAWTIRGSDQQHPDEGADGPGGVADDGRQAQGEQPEQGRGRGRRRPRPAGHPGCRRVAVGVEPDRMAWPMKKAAKHQHLAHHQRHHAEHQGLGRQHQRAVGHGGQRGPDGAGAVLGAHHQHPEHADGQLAEQDAGQALADRVEGQPFDERRAGSSAGPRPRWPGCRWRRSAPPWPPGSRWSSARCVSLVHSDAQHPGRR